ncbi:hypothetical protein Z945_1049 [Sulfitobacter noctilucae]|nr:hypothetical protein Z945_1049 [Sulfitobacter noctilucae]
MFRGADKRAARQLRDSFDAVNLQIYEEIMTDVCLPDQQFVVPLHL